MKNIFFDLDFNILELELELLKLNLNIINKLSLFKELRF